MDAPPERGRKRPAVVLVEHMVAEVRIDDVRLAFQPEPGEALALRRQPDHPFDEPLSLVQQPPEHAGACRPPDERVAVAAPCRSPAQPVCPRPTRRRRSPL